MRDDGIRLAQAQVRAFHEKFGRERPATPLPYPEETKLQSALLFEEVLEAIRAAQRGDMVELADGLADVVYIALGWATRVGVDLQPIWDRVHASNMAKEGGATREDGKILKPEGWVPPDVEGALVEQGWVKP